LRKEQQADASTEKKQAGSAQQMQKADSSQITKLGAENA